jgi:hypothetical protein
MTRLRPLAVGHGAAAVRGPAADRLIVRSATPIRPGCAAAREFPVGPMPQPNTPRFNFVRFHEYA